MIKNFLKPTDLQFIFYERFRYKYQIDPEFFHKNHRMLLLYLKTDFGLHKYLQIFHLSYPIFLSQFLQKQEVVNQKLLIKVPYHLSFCKGTIFGFDKLKIKRIFSRNYDVFG